MSTYRFNPLVSACRKIYLLGSFALNMKTLLLKYFDLWKQLKKAKIDFISIAIKFFSKLLNQPVGKAKKLKVKSFQIRQIWFTLIYFLFRFWELSFEHIFDEIDFNDEFWCTRFLNSRACRSNAVPSEVKVSHIF